MAVEVVYRSSRDLERLFVGLRTWVVPSLVTFRDELTYNFHPISNLHAKKEKNDPSKTFTPA